MFQTKVVEKIETQILCLITPPPHPENRALCEIMWKNAVERGQATDDKIPHALVCPVPKATNAYSKYVILMLFPCKMVARTRLDVTLYVQCLSCFCIPTQRTFLLDT
jgi:hypothetical protein